MSLELQTVRDTSRLTATSALQRLLPELVALSLDAKQIHWNITGPMFLPLHAFTDEIAADTREWADRVAERAVALGFSVDARPSTVAAIASQLPGDWIRDREAIVELAQRTDVVAAVARDAIAELEEADPVGHDLTVEILEGIEKYRWMLNAQTA